MKKVVIVMMLLCSAMGVEAQEHNCGKCSKEVNPVIDAIMSRTSIRQYQERAVGSDTIEILLRAGMAAPTAVNKQPWYLVVVQNHETLEGGSVGDSSMWRHDEGFRGRCARILGARLLGCHGEHPACCPCARTWSRVARCLSYQQASRKREQIA